MAGDLRETGELFRHRRDKLLKHIKGECALVVAAPERLFSHDQRYPYRPDSNFYYLTGIVEPEAALVLRSSSTGPRSVLFIRERDETAKRWTGELMGLRRARRVCPVDEVREFGDLERDLVSLVAGSQVLHYSPGIHSRMDQLVWGLLQSPTGPRPNAPHTIRDLRLLLHEMRLVKDRAEIRTIRHAVDITVRSFLRLIPDLSGVKSELHAARLLESIFAELGASGAAFPTIVASGKNAACLHHSPRLQPLWQKELVLIDAGAVFNGYAADLTRTVPPSGKFTSAQRDAYEIVLTASDAGLKKARPGSTLDDIHQTVSLAITEGLVGARIVRGNVQTLHAAGKFRKYYMHRSGHPLGLDVHDVTSPVSPKKVDFESAYARPLVSGQIFTLEPGIYFDADDRSVAKHFRGIGIRLEDDILVTDQGATNLSAALPRTVDGLRALFE